MEQVQLRILKSTTLWCTAVEALQWKQQCFRCDFLFLVKPNNMIVCHWKYVFDISRFTEYPGIRSSSISVFRGLLEADSLLLKIFCFICLRVEWKFLKIELSTMPGTKTDINKYYSINFVVISCQATETNSDLLSWAHTTMKIGTEVDSVGLNLGAHKFLSGDCLSISQFCVSFILGYVSPTFPCKGEESHQQL